MQHALGITDARRLGELFPPLPACCSGVVTFIASAFPATIPMHVETDTRRIAELLVERLRFAGFWLVVTHFNQVGFFEGMQPPYPGLSRPQMLLSCGSLVRVFWGAHLLGMVPAGWGDWDLARFF
jgi:hypothetical protein